MVVTLGNSAHPHPIPQRLLTSLTIVSGLLQENLPLLGGDADEALVAGHVPPLGVGVDHSVLLPLAQALIFPLLNHLRPVEAVEDGVEHDLGIVTVGVELGTQSLRVWDDAGVLPSEHVRRLLHDVHPALGGPRPLLEVLVATQGVIVSVGGVEADLDLHGVDSPLLHPETLELLVPALSPRVDQEPLLTPGAVGDTLPRVRLEGPVVLVHHGVPLEADVLPLTLQPLGEDAGGGELGRPGGRRLRVEDHRLVASVRGVQVGDTGGV